MKKTIALILFGLLSIGAAAAEKPLGIEELKSVDAVATEIASYFPKVQGEVKNVEGDRLTIGLGSKNGLVAGVTLSLWRDGKEILHPVTGAVIGRTEDEVGTVEVVAVSDTSCTAALRVKKKEPKAGDKARITPKKINLAVLPLQPDHPNIIQGLADRLTDLGRFMVLGNDKVSDFLKTRKERDTSLIKEMSKEFSLDVVAACSTYPSEGGKVLLTTKLFYAGEARPFETIVAVLDLQEKKEIFNEVKPYFAPMKNDKAGIPELPFEARFMIVSDFELRGSPQYAFSDGQRIHIYKHSATGWTEEWAEPAPADIEDRQHVNLDAADINGNGAPELFVTVMQKGKVFSYVIEYRDGSYQRIAEVPVFLRVISYPGKGMLLLGQAYDPKTFFAGKPNIYIWSSGKYTADREFPLPKGLKLYGFAFIMAGEANPLIVGFDDTDHVVVYSRESVIWKSGDTYPSIGVSAAKAVTTPSAVISQSVADWDSNQKVRIAGRILAMDTNGDGREEVIVLKNISSPYLPGFVNAEFVNLGWTGTRLEQQWSIADIGGPVLDFQLLKNEGTGAQILALVQIPGGLFGSDHFRVQSYTAK
jgi:hypothetical protein